VDPSIRFTDEEYRRQLSESKVSVFDFGLSLNDNINDADFPRELKKRCAEIYAQTNGSEAYPKQLELIQGIS
jgi:hypothetical protein